jgi:hypothetical protein
MLQGEQVQADDTCLETNGFVFCFDTFHAKNF